MNADTRAKLIELADAHQQADEYRSGHYDWNGGACAVGCTIRDAQALGLVPATVLPHDHAALAACTNIPEMVWRLVDHTFEGLPKDYQAGWPPRFFRAVRAGSDYTNLPARIMARCARKLAEDAPQLRELCLVVASLWDRRATGDEPTPAEWAQVEQQAYAAWVQAYAAWRQAYAAREQAYAAREQADAAREQADAAWEQAYAARHDFWRWCADMLCEELAK